MTVAIGIRARPKEIFYSVMESTDGQTKLLSSSKLIIPVALSMPEQLKFVRTTMLDIIYEFGATKAGIRITESFAPGADNTRVGLEAVIQELLASSSVESYFVGQIANISRRLSFPKENFKKFVANELEYQAVENWRTFGKEAKESILVGLASF